MECLSLYLNMVTVPHIMVGLERMLDYRGVGLERFTVYLCTSARLYQYLVYQDTMYGTILYVSSWGWVYVTQYNCPRTGAYMHVWLYPVCVCVCTAYTALLVAVVGPRNVTSTTRTTSWRRLLLETLHWSKVGRLTNQATLPSEEVLGISMFPWRRLLR